MVLLTLLCVPALTVSADKSTELAELKNQIKEVKTEIDRAQQKVGKLYKELEVDEKKIADTYTQLHVVEYNISAKRAEIVQLEATQNTYQSKLSLEKEKLSQQIRVAYQTGKNDYIKLVLNQENIALIGRMLAYYNYYHLAQTKYINTLKKTLAELTTIQSSIQSETKKLEILRSIQEKKISELQKHRTSRNATIDRLEEYIKTQGLKLDSMEEHERELKKLIANLSQKKTSVPDPYTSIPEFNRLKGQLIWPVDGKLLTQFGQIQKGSHLKRQGVLLGAKANTKVKSISAGKVIFADWFRSLGLLIIIDHGDDYMSIYGHNQNLLKNSGDWVAAGEHIATVGNSGGQKNIGLYFEIRKGTKPLNPVLWCKKINN